MAAERELVAVGDSDTILHSLDGINWSSRTSPTSGVHFVEVAWSDGLGLWVAVGPNQALVTSPDGINWTDNSPGTDASEDFTAVAWSESQGKFLVGGDHGRIWYSSDGINWSAYTAVLSTSPPMNILWVESLSKWFLNQREDILSSTDGSSWTKIHEQPNQEEFDDIAWSESLSLFVGVGYTDVLYTSPNGSSWTFRSTPVSTIRYSVAWSESEGLFVVGAQSGVTITSPDGINWTWHNTRPNTNHYWFGVAWSGALWVLVGSGGGTWTSPDAINWTVRTSGTASSLRSIAVGPTLNTPPEAPTLVSPVGGETIPLDQSNVLDYDFNDPDSGDTQSRTVGEIRVAGGAVAYSWDVETTSTQHTLPADTLAAGDYEWRVKTYDALGEEGPWSSWEPFSGAVTPGAPTIVAPSNGEMIATESYLVEWSTSAQGAYQGQRVADNAGSIDVGTVYWDSGTQGSSSARSYDVDFPTNNRFEWIRWRIRRDGLWSPWAEVRIEVSYTPPPTPTIVLTEGNSLGTITVDITNPAPGVGEPAIESNRIFKRKSSTDSWVRVAIDISPDGSYLDYNIAVGQNYEYYAQAIGDNGTSSISSAVTSPGVVFKGSKVHPVNDPTNTHHFRYNGNGGDESWEPEVHVMAYAGRTLPTAEFGEAETENILVNLSLDGEEEVNALLSIAKLKSILCYRDSFGRFLFCIIPNLNIQARFFGGQTVVTFQGVDYSEEV